MLKRVELLTRAGCCLCHTARAQLDAVRAERPFDLVEIDNQPNPPLFKIMDYGRFKYEQAKQARQRRDPTTQ